MIAASSEGTGDEIEEEVDAVDQHACWEADEVGVVTEFARSLKTTTCVVLVLGAEMRL